MESGLGTTTEPDPNSMQNWEASDQDPAKALILQVLIDFISSIVSIGIYLVLIASRPLPCRFRSFLHLGGGCRYSPVRLIDFLICSLMSICLVQGTS